MSTSSAPVIKVHHVANVAAALGTFVGLNNTYGLLKPQGALAQLGFRPAVSPSDQELVNGLLRMFSATRIVLGISQVVTWWYADYKVLGWQMAVGVLMAGVDGWVSKTVSGGGEWGHWGAAPVGLGLGLWLLFSTS